MHESVSRHSSTNSELLSYRNIHWWCICWGPVPFCYREALLVRFGWRAGNTVPMWGDDSVLCTWVCCSYRYGRMDWIILLRIFYVHANQTQCQKLHTVRVLFFCRHCKKQRRTWSSSRVLAGHYLVNEMYVVVVLRIPYSRKFSYGANFRIFRTHTKIKTTNI